MSARPPMPPGTTAGGLSLLDSALFARLLQHRRELNDLAGLGLAPGQLASLLHGLGRAGEAASVAPPAPPALWSADDLAFMRAAQTLLWRHRVHDAPATLWLSQIVARACLRPDHLWRDLGLDGREDVSALLLRHFPGLVARNTQQLRWKKFLAQEVNVAQGWPASHAPGCPSCEDFGHCYPGATGPAARAA